MLGQPRTQCELRFTLAWRSSRELAEIGAFVERRKTRKPGLEQGELRRSVSGDGRFFVRKPDLRLGMPSAVEARQAVVEPVAHKRQRGREQCLGLQQPLELRFRRAGSKHITQRPRGKLHKIEAAAQRSRQRLVALTRGYYKYSYLTQPN